MTTTKPITTRTAGRWTAAIAAGVCLLTAWTATVHATSTASRPPAQPTAVAVVNLPRVLENLDERASLEGALQSSLQERQKSLDELAARIEAASNEVQNVLTPGSDDYKEKVRELIEYQALAEARRNVLQRIISFEKGQTLRTIYVKISSATERLAERNGYDLVMIDDSKFALPAEAAERDMERAILGRSLVYSHGAVDITDDVIQLLNNDYAAGRP